MNFLSQSGIVFILFLFPFTLHSTDIYTSSQGTVKILASLNSHVIPGDSRLGNTILLVSTPEKNTDIHLVTTCTHTQSVLYTTTKDARTLSVIQVVFPTFCDMPMVRVGDRENIFTDTIFPLQMESYSEVEKHLLNVKNENLLIIMRKQGLLENTGATLADKLERIHIKYKNFDIDLQSNIARDILQARNNEKYISPVIGYSLPSSPNLIPGANRSYRKDTTDGIHHGWDILAPFGTPVQALAKGKIIRIKNNWNWSEFDNLRKENLTKDEALQNLDIFRGNQVWLQTMDGNVIFYSHLSKISPDIMVGSNVEAGIYLGNIGKSGVPDKNYKDIHLHFEIQENPFSENMENPTYMDIMRWNYIGEGLKRSELYVTMEEIFK